MPTEHLAVSALIATALVMAAASIDLSGKDPAQRRAAGLLARRIACAPRLRPPCRPDPLVEAYGRPLARLVRGLSPAARAAAGPRGDPPLIAVDFRRCRRPSCAAPSASDPLLSTANRRATAFVAVEDRRRGRGWVEVAFLLYRPPDAWRRLAVRVGREEVGRLSAPLRPRGDLRLVASEEIPWHRRPGGLALRISKR